jgi:hypothetical protein
MDKVHDVKSVTFSGECLILVVDGRRYEIAIAQQSKRLAGATKKQRENYEVSPSGYGIHWPEIDEDLSIDGLIGIRHESPVMATGTKS